MLSEISSGTTFSFNKCRVSGTGIRKMTVFLLFFVLLHSQTLADTYPPLPPPVFSHTSGFYSAPFGLILSTDVPAANIYYTIDGSEPDPGNLSGSTYTYKNTWVEQPGQEPGQLLTGFYRTHTYEDPIFILNRRFEEDRITNKASSYHNPPYYFPDAPVVKGTVVRAITARAGDTPSPVVSHTYFIMDRNRYDLPVIAISTGEQNLFDYNKGIYTPGKVFDNWRENNPDRNADGGRPGNYHQRGRDWEHPASFTFWDSGSPKPELNQEVGIRIHGGWSRAQPMKSLRIYARSDYGNSRLEYPFFPDQDYDTYKRLILRNSGNDNPNTLFRDALIQRVCREMSFDTQAYRPVIVFLNGEYWGIHNIRERYDKHYIKRVYDIDEEDLDLLTGNAWRKEGNNHHYVETIEYIEANGLQEDIHYEYIQTRIDTDNFIDYQIANIYSANTDWPSNNIDFFRKRTDSYQPYTPHGHDGRWRWMAFDMDFGFGIWGKSPNENVLEFATATDGPGWPNPPWSTFLLRSFLENEEFRTEFLNRFADLLNSAFLPERVTALIDEYQQVLEPSFQEHINRWKRPTSIDGLWEWNSWYNQINMMRTFANQRDQYQWGHLIDYFGRDTVPVILDVSDPEHGYIRVNSVDIRPGSPGVGENAYPWRGKYFSGIPVEIEAVAKEGYIFSHWEGKGNGENPVVMTFDEEAGVLTAHFVPAAEKELVHYWHFNDLPDDDSLLIVTSDYSAGNRGEITYPGDGLGYMDMVEDGTNINLQMSQQPLQGLRVRNPSDTREMIIHASSQAHESLVLSFAVRRTANGAYNQTLYASPDKGNTWTATGDTYVIDEEWQLVSTDLSGFPELNDNPDLQFRIVFGGENAGGTSGNNRFDNVSLEGEFIYETRSYYSKSEGGLDNLSTWGDNPDGSGISPDSFSEPGYTYHIRNRAEATIAGNWAVSGVSSGVILGDGTAPVVFTVPPAFAFSGRMKISDNATLVLQNSSLPVLEDISPNSTVVFEQNEMVVVPANSYGNLHLQNSMKLLAGNYSLAGDLRAEDVELSFVSPAELTIEGNLSYLGTVITTDPENVNIYAAGENDQLFLSENENRVDGYNIYLEKNKGTFTTATDIYARNNLRLEFSGDASFSDGGHVLRLDDDLRIRGNINRYDLTGTVLLTAETGTNDMEIINVPVHNLVIDVTGDARVDFNDASELVIINNDLTIKSSSSRPVRFRDKRFHIKGDLLLDISGPDQTEKGESRLVFNGNNQQFIDNEGYDGHGLLHSLVVNNENGLTIREGSITFDGELSLKNGIVHTGNGNLLKLGPPGTVADASGQSYVIGPMGRYTENGELVSATFPVGKDNGIRPVILDLEIENGDPTLFIAEYFDELIPHLAEFEEKFDSVEDEGYYSIEAEGEPGITRASITLSYRDNAIPAEELTVAMRRNEEWIDLGAEFVTGQPKVIRSAVGFHQPGIFTLAGRKDIPNYSEEPGPLSGIYPNPVPLNGTVYLPERMDIRLIDMTGVTLMTRSNVDRVNLQGIPAGVYIITNPRGMASRIVVMNR